MVVGGYAVILSRYSRSTGDMDIWVNKTPENYQKLLLAITEVGLPEAEIMVSQFLSPDYDVFLFGRPPYAIEVMTAVKGLVFDPAYWQSTIVKVDALAVRDIHSSQLIEAKQAAGRNKDLNDLDNLPAK